MQHPLPAIQLIIGRKLEERKLGLRLNEDHGQLNRAISFYAYIKINGPEFFAKQGGVLHEAFFQLTGSVELIYA